MKSALISFLVLALMLVHTGLTAGNDVPSSPSPSAVTISLTGKVTDAVTGETLTGAMVEVEGTQISVFTDLEGAFSISQLKSGTYNLKVKYISYEDKRIESVKFDEKNACFDIALQSK